MKKNYSELLLDPRWQKKRLEILQRDNFECRACQQKEETLHVHHVRYTANAKPWEYNDDDLVTLCKSCHEVWGMLDRTLKGSGYGWEHLPQIVDLYWDIEVIVLNKYLAEQKNKNHE